MTQYRRIYTSGASWFFTVNLKHRQNNRLLVEQVDLLREAFLYVKQRKSYTINAVVIMPDHLHCIWTLPEGDTDYSGRWSLLKGYFSRGIPKGEPIGKSGIKRRERGIWQRRFWAHLLTDQGDFNIHFDYIHWNPVKHGWVEFVQDWSYSSFHRYVESGVYGIDWGHSGDFSVEINE
ncbi:MAG: transposase, IS200/IS605 family [Methyloprofundus sp.]|nr:MAG: transposase, IS200/IS605 family [Methyloprofundus sp.]